MGTSRWLTAAGVVALVAGPMGQLVQFVVTPIAEVDSASTQLTQAADHLSRLQWAVWLDLFILLIAPAVLCAGSLAGARTSKLAAAATGLIFVTWLGAGYLLGSDALLYVAAQDPDRASADRLVEAYLTHPVVTAVVIAYVAGHVVGFVLLGIALARSRVVPRWAAIAVAVWPFGELAGEASGLRWLAAGGFALLAVGFGSCAAAWLHRGLEADHDAVAVDRIASTTTATT